jgi:hypothetical protein
MAGLDLPNYLKGKSEGGAAAASKPADENPTT